MLPKNKPVHYFQTNNKNNDLKLSIRKKIADVIAEDQELIEKLRTEVRLFSQSLLT